jgi:8-oxo-dGTP diphosphatase
MIQNAVNVVVSYRKRIGIAILSILGFIVVYLLATGEPEPHYRNPATTVDAFAVRKNNGRIQVLLIRRGIEPSKNLLATPGGFVEYGEDPEDTVLREIQEETSMSVSKPVHLVTVNGAPNRDPRKHTISIIYALKLTDTNIMEMKAKDDAMELGFYDFDEILSGKIPLAFDHLRGLRRCKQWFDEKGEKLLL